MLHRRGFMAGCATLAGGTAFGPGTAHAQGRVLFQQPSYPDGIAPHFSVTGVVPASNPVGKFYLHANQPNPFRSDSSFVPVGWTVANKTGLHVPNDSINWQRGIFDARLNTAAGQTAAQVHDGVVGAYLITLRPGSATLQSAP